MSLYSVAVPSANSTVSTPVVDIRAPANTHVKVLEIGFFNAQASTAQHGIGRSPNVVTQTSQINVLPEDPTDPSPGQSTVATTWTTAPLQPLQFFRRPSFPAASIGAGFIFIFRQGLGLPPAGISLVIWNIIANTLAVTAWFVVDE